MVVDENKVNLLDSINKYKQHYHSVILLKQHPHYKTSLQVMVSFFSMEINHFILFNNYTSLSSGELYIDIRKDTSSESEEFDYIFDRSTYLLAK